MTGRWPEVGAATGISARDFEAGVSGSHGAAGLRDARGMTIDAPMPPTASIAASCSKTGQLVRSWGHRGNRRAGAVFLGWDGSVRAAVAKSLGFSGQIEELPLGRAAAFPEQDDP